MRTFIFVSIAAAALTATPALAQDRAAPLRDMSADQAAALLSNPVAQDMAASLIGQLADAFLDTRVGPMAMLTDPRDDVRPNDTLGDMVRRDNPDFDRRLRDNTKRSLAVAGGAVRGAAAMTREFERTAERMRGVLDGVTGY